MIFGKKIKMGSKVAFIFLAICFITMIDLGISFQCFMDCEATIPGCKDGKKKIDCASGVKWCARSYPGSGRICLWDSGVEGCRNSPGCNPCDTDSCNE